MKPDKYQELALKTWYTPDNPLYLGPRHPLIKLAGEAGELLDLYGKHEYKPDFDWWDCKICHCSKFAHGESTTKCNNNYTPFVLDELGDLYYYLRIVTWQQKISIEEWLQQKPFGQWAISKDLDYILARIASDASGMLVWQLEENQIDIHDLRSVFDWFIALLSKLDCSLDHLTELNYKKLNSEPTAHGWKR